MMKPVTLLLLSPATSLKAARSMVNPHAFWKEDMLRFPDGILRLLNGTQRLQGGRLRTLSLLGGMLRFLSSILRFLSDVLGLLSGTLSSLGGMGLLGGMSCLKDTRFRKNT